MIGKKYVPRIWVSNKWKPYVLHNRHAVADEMRNPYEICDNVFVMKAAECGRDSQPTGPANLQHKPAGNIYSTR